MSWCLIQGFATDPAINRRAEERSRRRKHQLDQIEIPANQVKIIFEMRLGKGGFGAVYLADYGGRSAAAKVKRK